MPTDEEALHQPISSPVADERGLLNLERNNDLPSVPPAPSSGNIRLPMRKTDTQKQPPMLLHPFLHKVPMHIRFGLNGFLSNVGFMVAYNSAVVQFESMAPPSTIYSVVYLIFIPISHALISLLVFGWPERYIPSLMSNAPIGLTAIALGALLTAYLDQVEFNKFVAANMKESWSYLGYDTTLSPEEEKGEFYSSLLVLLITGVWTFVLSVMINSPSETSEKKEN